MTLFEIKKKVSERLEVRKRKIPFDKLSKTVEIGSLRRLDKVFPKNNINIIAEIKRASPSEGDIALDAEPLSVAREYVANGARALSILTEPDFFKGDISFISKIRKNLPEAFILMKDFILDEYQLVEGAKVGADAILLIVAMLEKEKFIELLVATKKWNLHPLVEVHSEAEMRIALDAGAKFIGVNNRDLKTMKINLKISEELASFKDQTEVLISESGLSTGHQLKILSELGYDGFLMGTPFMKAPSPGRKLAEVLKEGQECPK